eukprot:m.40689 g.40689  ORF g.40689 m.40689 type:complete len:339 (-) comp14141_c0_seq1:32-1048(-)
MADDSLAKRMRHVLDEKEEFPVNPKFFELLRKMRVHTFYEPSATIFVCEREDNVLDVFKGMVKHRFLSVPVLSKTEHKFFGSVDMADIVTHVVKKFNKEDLRGEEKFWQQMTEANSFKDVKVKDIIRHPVSYANPYKPVEKGYSMMYACELLAREKELHRLPVVDENHKIINLITQSKVVEFMNANKDLLGEFANKPLAKCPSTLKPVVSVNKNTPAIDAFSKMLEQHVSGVALVDDVGTLVGGLSLRDLKVMGTGLQSFWRMYGTAENFEKWLRTDEEARGGKRKLLYVLPSATVGEVLSLLNEHKSHRFIIVESEKKLRPTGVVSLKDILVELLGI